jgi:hypothetical protein
MTQEEIEKIKELEEKIKCIQADIDLLCNFSNRAENKKNTIITMSPLVGVSLVVDGEVVDYTIVNNVPWCKNYSIDTLINCLMTEKRLMEIDLNQLKIGDDEDE